MIRYKTKEINIKSFKGIKLKDINEVIIVQYNINNPDVWYPSPFKSFIQHKYRRTIFTAATIRSQDCKY